MNPTLTTEEKVFLIECFYRGGRNYTEAYRGFRSKYGSKKISSKATLKRTAQAIDLRRKGIREIQRDVIQMHPYKISTYQLLTVTTMEERVQFCKTTIDMLDRETLDEKQIIFTGEANFWLNGYVNKRDYRFWGKENPNMSIAVPLHHARVSAWTAISAKGVYLKFFDATVTGPSYSKLLENKFLSHATKRGLKKNFYILQDGATSCRAHDILEPAREVYGDKFIGTEHPRFVPRGLEWPPYSPDLNPCDFFLWGYIKDKCYVEQPQNVDELKKNIRRSIRDISPSMLREVFKSFRKRLKLCADSDGQHFENIYH